MKLTMREIIAKAIEDAEYDRREPDDPPYAENYAGRHGYADYDWLSDWGAHAADLVIHRLETEGFQIK